MKLVALSLLMLVSMGSAQICGDGWCLEDPGFHATYPIDQNAIEQPQMTPDQSSRAQVTFTYPTGESLSRNTTGPFSVNVPEFETEDAYRINVPNTPGQEDERAINFLLLSYDDKNAPVDHVALFLGFSSLNVNVTQDGIVTLDNGEQRQLKYVFPFWQLVEVG